MTLRLFFVSFLFFFPRHSGDTLQQLDMLKTESVYCWTEHISREHVLTCCAPSCTAVFHPVECDVENRIIKI